MNLVVITRTNVRKYLLLLFSARQPRNLCCVLQYTGRFDIHLAPRCEKLGNEFFGNPLWTHPEWKKGALRAQN